MSGHAQTVFLIEQMQPDWIHNPKEHNFLKFVTGIAIGLVLGPFGAIVAKFIFAASNEIAFLLGAILSFHFGLVALLVDINNPFDQIKPIETISLSAQKLVLQRNVGDFRPYLVGSLNFEPLYLVVKTRTLRCNTSGSNFYIRLLWNNFWTDWRGKWLARKLVR